jgi:pimeloyl-ACP methyl ester carboxylesterase
MTLSPFDVLHGYDPSTTRDGVDLQGIAERMGAAPPEVRAQSLTLLAAATPQPAAPQPVAGDAKSTLVAALSAIEGGDSPRGYALLDTLMIEWSRRAALETWVGHSVLGLDAQGFRACLPPGPYSADTVKWASEHLEALAAILRASSDGGPALVSNGQSFTRSELVANLGLTKPDRSFLNPCRPLRAQVTHYPQREGTWNGRPIRYVDVPATSGQARPPLVLIHGHSSCAEEYDPLIDALRPLLTDVRILVPDLPSSGYSWAPGWGTLSTAVYRKFLREWLAGIGVTKYVPAGGSLGGNLTLQLLAEAPASEIPCGIAWSPVAWCDPSNALDWLSSGALAAKTLHLFWPVYDQDKKHWYPNWTASKALAELRASDIYRHEVDTDAYESMYFDLAYDQTAHLQKQKSSLIQAPVRLMAGTKDHDVMTVYDSTKALAAVLAQRGVACDFFDGFAIGDHSLATEEPPLVAAKLAEWYRKHT